VDIVSGLHWYLKHLCGSHISWDKTGGSQLFSVPNVGFLPRVHDTGILVQRPVPWSYYQNAVTSSCKLLFCFHIIFVSSEDFVSFSCDLVICFWKILLLGGTGKDGKRKSTGWLCKVSTCHLHLQDRRLSGRKCSRSFSYQFVFT